MTEKDLSLSSEGLPVPAADAVGCPVEDPTDASDLATSVVGDADRWQLFLGAAQAALAVAALVVVVLAPDRVGDLVVRIASVAVLIYVLATIIAELESDPRSRLRLVGAGFIGVGALLLIIDPDRFVLWVGRVGGVGAAAVGLVLIATASRSDEAGKNRRFSQAALLVSGGAVAAIAFTPLVQLFAIAAVVLLAATAALRAGAQTGAVGLDVDSPDSRPLLLRWIDAKSKTPQRREDIYEQVFFEGPTAASRVGRFMLMMLFASVISAAGVLSDSTAVVIGAMLVAPLISPMMGMGLSIATGWPNRLGRSTLLVVGGILIAVGTGWLLASTRVAVDLLSNSQIVSRPLAGVVVLALLVVGGLRLNGRQIAADSFDQDQATEVVAEWLGDEPDFALVSVDVDDGRVAVLLAGPGEPPDPQSLVDDLAEGLGNDVELDLQWIPRNRIVVSSSD